MCGAIEIARRCRLRHGSRDRRDVARSDELLVAELAKWQCPRARGGTLGTRAETRSRQRQVSAKRDRSFLVSGLDGLNLAQTVLE